MTGFLEKVSRAFVFCWVGSGSGRFSLFLAAESWQRVCLSAGSHSADVLFVSGSLFPSQSGNQLKSCENVQTIKDDIFFIGSLVFQSASWNTGLWRLGSGQLLDSGQNFNFSLRRFKMCRSEPADVESCFLWSCRDVWLQWLIGSSISSEQSWAAFPPFLTSFPSDTESRRKPTSFQTLSFLAGR